MRGIVQPALIAPGRLEALKPGDGEAGRRLINAFSDRLALIKVSNKAFIRKAFGSPVELYTADPGAVFFPSSNSLISRGK